MSYRSDRAWSDRFIPAIKRIVGPHLLEPSSLEVDTQQAADLTVLTGRNLTIAARVRRHRYAERWPYEFTMRAERTSGARTELQKVIDRWGDWFLYGHAINDTDPEIGRWMIVDLHSFRSSYARRIIAPGTSGMRKNPDGKTSFAYFDVRGFAQCRDPILIASSFTLDEPPEPPEPPEPKMPPPTGKQQLDLFT
jgi:hypothetical protein